MEVEDQQTCDIGLYYPPLSTHIHFGCPYFAEGEEALVSIAIESQAEQNWTKSGL